jgi:DNA-binding XRE family transcriptional regulator
MTHSMTTQATETPFPARLKAFRATYGLTQQQLATRLEIARNTVKSWERGDPRRKPHVLSESYNVSLLPTAPASHRGEPTETGGATFSQQLPSGCWEDGQAGSMPV